MKSIITLRRDIAELCRNYVYDDAHLGAGQLVLSVPTVKGIGSRPKRIAYWSSMSLAPMLYLSRESAAQWLREVRAQIRRHKPILES